MKKLIKKFTVLLCVTALLCSMFPMAANANLKRSGYAELEITDRLKSYVTFNVNAWEKIAGFSRVDFGVNGTATTYYRATYSKVACKITHRDVFMFGGLGTVSNVTGGGTINGNNVTYTYTRENGISVITKPNYQASRTLASWSVSMRVDSTITVGSNNYPLSAR
jgi:hypothetical protein